MWHFLVREVIGIDGMLNKAELWGTGALVLTGVTPYLLFLLTLLLPDILDKLSWCSATLSHAAPAVCVQAQWESVYLVSMASRPLDKLLLAGTFQ